MAPIWYEEPGCSGMGTIGNAPVPYFVCGVIAILGLVQLGSTLYKSDNTVMRGLKSIDLILPVYVIPVWYVLTIGIIVGVSNIIGLLTTEVYTSIIKWGLYRFVAEGLAVFLMHNGIGERALRNAVLAGAAWGIISSGAILYMQDMWGYSAYSVQAVIGLSITLAFYLVLWILPQRYLHRRPAMVNYAFWNVLILSLFIVVFSLLGYLQYSIASCSVEIILSICWMLQPFIIVFAMRQDSLFWQGLYSNPEYRMLGCSLGGSFFNCSKQITNFSNRSGVRTNINDGLLGIWDFGRDTMGMWADTITTLETKVVPIIPFGFIDNISNNFFTGGSARVYRARYRDTEVAVKVLFCIELTKENVADFVAEATLLNSLQHDNVVQCMGVSIMPPAICLVTEFCTYGSLYDFLHHTDMYINEYIDANSSINSQSNPSRNRLGTGSTSLSHVSVWSSAASESQGSTDLRDSQGSTSEASDGDNTGRGSFGLTGSYNANNSKHTRSLLENLPEIIEGSEHSFELSQQSQQSSQCGSISSTTTSMTSASIYMGFIDTTSPIKQDKTLQRGGGHYRTASPEVKSSNSGSSLDIAGVLAQEVMESKENADTKERKKSSNAASGQQSNEANRDELNNSSGPGTSNGSFGNISTNIRRRHDSAEYFVERDASGSMLNSGLSIHFDKDGTQARINKAEKERAETALTESLLAEDYLASDKANRSSAGARSSGGAASASLDSSNQEVRLRKLSCVLTDEKNMGIGPSISTEVRNMVKNIREANNLVSSSSADPSSAGGSNGHSALSVVDDVEKGGVNVSTGSPAGKRGLAMRPTSPTSITSMKDGQAIVSLAQICVPARVRLFSEKLDISANMGDFLASRDLSTFSRFSSGTNRNSGGNNAYYNSKPEERPKRAVLVIPLSLRIRMAKDCCSGVAYLHSNGFMHCDIKSLNFLVDRHFNVKLSDLGEARAKSQASQEVRAFPTNVNWSAPEVLSEENIITTAADIWSLAMVIVEILTGDVPFDTMEWRQLQIGDFLERLKDGQRPNLPASISDQFPWVPKIIAKAWKFSAAERCDCLEITDVFIEEINTNFACQHRSPAVH